MSPFVQRGQILDRYSTRKSMNNEGDELPELGTKGVEKVCKLHIQNTDAASVLTL